MIIAFSPNSSRIIPQIFCRKFRHCAPIIEPTRGRFIMYQFVHRGHIAQIYLTTRAIKILGANGWHFIPVSAVPPRDLMQRARACRSCVAFCKLAIGICSARTFTPLGLYRLLAKSARHWRAQFTSYG